MRDDQPIACPDGHPVHIEWRGAITVYAYAYCDTCLKAWRIQRRDDGTWEWERSMLPDEHGDKPVNFQPFKPRR